MPSIFIQPDQLPWFIAPIAEPIEGDLFAGCSVLDFGIVGSVMMGGLIVIAVICEALHKGD